MTATTLVLLCLAAEGYPLAAAFVLDGNIAIAQMGSQKLEHVAVPTGHTALAADLRPDKSLIIAELRANAGGPSFLSIYDTKKIAWSPIDTGLAGAHRSPRFTPDGRYAIFGNADSNEGGPDHPTQIWRLEIGGATKPVKLSTQANYCHFSASPLDASRFAAIATNCYFDFEVRVYGTKAATKLGPAHGATDELASSFDGKTVVRMEKLDAEFVLSVVRDGKARPLHRFRGESGASGQPRFVCPRDAMFLENGIARVINTKTGEVKTVGEGIP